MANFQGNGPFGGGYFPPQYLQSQSHPYVMQQQYVQAQNSTPIYNHLPASSPQIFTANSAAYNHNNQFTQQHIPATNPGPPPHFFPNPLPAFSANVPPPPFPPQPIPTNPNFHGSIASSKPQSFVVNGTSTQQPSPWIGKDSLTSPNLNQELVSASRIPNQGALTMDTNQIDNKFGNIDSTESIITSFPNYPPQEITQNNMDEPEPLSTGLVPQGDLRKASEFDELDRLSQTFTSKHGTDVLREPALTSTKPASTLTVVTGLDLRPNINPTDVKTGRRGLAKTALIELQKNEIGFEQLVREDIDREVLAKLYSELKIPLNQSTNQSARNAQISHEAIPHSSEPAEANSSRPPLPTRHYETAQTDSEDASESSLEPGEVAEADPGNINSPNESKEPNLLATVGGHLSRNVNPKPLGKDHNVSQDKKALERKDYIARLLAAKHSVQNPADKSTQPAQCHATADTPAELETSGINTASAISEVKKNELKDPAQTELVRQRLEALKNNNKAIKPTSNYLPQDETQTKFLIQTGNTNTPVSDILAPSGNARDDPQEEEYTPTNSFFASSHRSLFGALPGLSSTATSLPGLHSSASNVSEPSPSTITALANKVSISTPNIFESQVSEKPTRSRKRATAMDFIDSPPRQTKRRAGSSEPISVVIEVSDDDDDGGDDGAIEASAPSFSETPALEDRRAPRSLPPLTNITSRDSASSSVNTPIPTNPKNLAAHEEDIKALRQKIQEYELRKKAKKAIAEKQTMSALSKSRDLITPDAAIKIQASKGELEEVNKQLVEQKSSLGVLDTAITVAEEKLHAEERTQALIIARAENEHRGAIQASTDLERRNRLDRKAALEAALPKLELQIQSARNRLDDIRRQQKEIEAEIDKGIEGRDELTKELSALCASDNGEVGMISVAEHDMDRLSGIRNVASPTGDSEIALTPSQSPIVEQEYDDKKPTTVSVHDSGTLHPIPNDAFLEESMDISSDDEGQIISSHASRSSVSAPGTISPKLSNQSVNRGLPELPKITRPGNTRLAHDIHDNDADSETSHINFYSDDATKNSDISDGKGEDVASRLNSLSAAVDDVQIHQRKVIEPVSSSKEEEYESSERDVPALGFAAYLPTDNLNDTSADESEEYDPELQGSSKKAQGDPIAIDNSTPIERVSEGSSPSSALHNVPQNSDPDNLQKSIEYPSKEASSSDSLQEEGEVLEEDTEGLEYEPPEPPGPETNGEVGVSKTNALEKAFNRQDQRAKTSRSESASDISYALTQRDGDSKVRDTEDDRAEFSHFTPYESPLSLFNSYRYHPQYVSEIPGAFRSLTYNHKIDYARELCQWELAGGICNDSSCRFQHFRDLPSSDSETLISLANVHEGETEGQKIDYVSGLKKLINDMKLRNVNDINSVASEIVAYRSKFLQDSSRVLTNL